MAACLHFGIAPKLAAIEIGAAERLCQEYWKLLTDTPLAPSAVLSQRENHSSNRDYAKSSAALIQGTIGGQIDAVNFHHVSFTITLPDRYVDGNFFVFDFGANDSLKKYLAGRSKEALGKRGILTAKAPQQFKVGAKNNCLLVLVIDGVRIDEAAIKLFERFEQMTKAEAADQSAKTLKAPSSDAK